MWAENIKKENIQVLEWACNALATIANSPEKQVTYSLPPEISVAVEFCEEIVKCSTLEMFLKASWHSDVRNKRTTLSYKDAMKRLGVITTNKRK